MSHAARRARYQRNPRHGCGGHGALGGGDSVEDILADYPDITRNGICAAPAFAGRLARFKTVAYDGS